MDAAACSVFRVAHIAITGEIALIFVRALTSWLPNLPMFFAIWLRRLTDGVLYPFQLVVPVLGGFDLTPIIAIVVLGYINRFIPVCPSA
ncbi:MAG: YggT family protein [Candidatus Eremiobacteraeota bacterium]|nr:YggT family protein [Candidatus Eremiobacteraeota bacterium]MBC5826938.1 YggT family protein [Candidatus Eremiobacteraeota bacterium]